jgi:hypothetical protein
MVKHRTAVFTANQDKNLGFIVCTQANLHCSVGVEVLEVALELLVSVLHSPDQRCLRRYQASQACQTLRNPKT